MWIKIANAAVSTLFAIVRAKQDAIGDREKAGYCFRIYLNSSFAQVETHGKFFAGEDVRILSFLECAFQLVQLISGKRRPRAPHFPRSVTSIILSVIWKCVLFTRMNASLHDSYAPEILSERSVCFSFFSANCWDGQNFFASTSGGVSSIFAPSAVSCRSEV